MYIQSLKLEKAALKSYRNDPETDDEAAEISSFSFSKFWSNFLFSKSI